MTDAQQALDFAAGERRAAREVGRWSELAARPYRPRLGEAWHDAVQDAIAEVLRNVRDGDCRGDFKGYVWRSVVHTCIDRLRARRRRHAREGGSPESVPEPVAPPSDPTERRFLLEVARRCPPECRRLWQMILAGLSYREMSAELDVSEGEVRVRALRCRRRAAAIAAGLRSAPAAGGAEPVPPTPKGAEGRTGND